LFFSANYDRKLVTKIKFKSSLVPDIALLHHQHQQRLQERQYLIDMLTATHGKEIPPPTTFEELSPISESVVIPPDVNESSKQNYWIIHQ